jgi:ABC-type transport system involved in Fe-S cluster assembly fused permease/ATPase subunit
VLNLSALKHVRSEADPFTLMRMIDVNIFNTDNIVVLNQGRVDGYGKHLDLLSQNGWYAKAWKTQK